MPTALSRRADRELAFLRAHALLRQPPAISARNGVEYRLADRPVVGFCSNDYLGLAGRPTAARSEASGAGSSRLIAGDFPIHRQLQQALAALCHTADCVLFPSGFQLNVGVIPALLRANDRVYSDQLNHASIIDGLRLARATPSILPHAEPPPQPDARDESLAWWFTESVFSMDGDRVDTTVLHRHQLSGGALYVDDAHAFGLFAGGAGLLHDAPFKADVLVGTLSKACGSAGAFVCASRAICDLIRNRARSFIFSTGPSPALAADALRQLNVLTGQEGDELRTKLWQNARHFDAMLRNTPSGAATPPSPIFPVIVGDNITALAVADDLLRQGFHVQAIRPPTVPANTARLRVTVTAAHTLDQVESVAHAVRSALVRRGAEPPTAVTSPPRSSPTAALNSAGGR